MSTKAQDRRRRILNDPRKPTLIGRTLALYKPADIETRPVLYKPMAWAAAGERSISRPRTQGPRSLMRTVTHPLWQTRIWVPNGSLRWAAVIAAQFSRSPLAVLCPQRPPGPPYMLATSACAVPTKNSRTPAAMRLKQTSPLMRLPRPVTAPNRIQIFGSTKAVAEFGLTRPRNVECPTLPAPEF
jgi:hypothetical protein